MRVVLLVVALLLAGCSGGSAPHAASPTPSASPSPTATPALQPGDVRLAIGDSWAYALTRNGTDDGHQETAVVDLTGTTAILSSQTTTSGAPSQTRIEARQGDLAIVSVQSGSLGFTITYDPPLALVIPAADHAQTGNATLKGPTGTLSSRVNLTVKFLGAEDVTVPAGTFHALRYHILVETGGPGRQESDVWFAPAVKAPVKTVEANGQVSALTGYHVE